MTDQFAITASGLPPTANDVWVIYVNEGEAPGGTAGEVWATSDLDWSAISAAASFTGRQGQMIEILMPPNLPAKRLVVLGAGAPDAMQSVTAWADRGGSLMAKLAGATRVSVVIDEPGATPASIVELAAGMRLRRYRFDKYKTQKSNGGEAREDLAVTVHCADPEGVAAAMADRMAVVDGTILARNLVNEPPNVLGPAEFAAEAEALADLGVTVEVLGPEQMQALRMGALMAVARGSARQPRLVVMTWRGAAADIAPVAFVGKGVVFDTGGISIKPAGSMEDMKGDMGGAAAVTGLMRALAGRKARVNAVGVVGLVENMPDGDAYRPGDILKAMSGTTIEVVNTDAEGRLVLADALWYTQDRFKPRAMIDLATLTGAIGIALGHDHAGLFSNSDELAGALYAAGIASGEKVWRMPLGPAYDKQIESRFADIKNSGGRPAGSITAAQFLRRFVNNTAWAHLDIAGMAFGPPASETNTSWGTGFGVHLLDQLIRDTYEA